MRRRRPQLETLESRLAPAVTLLGDLTTATKPSWPSLITPVGEGRVVFTATDGVHGAEPWVSDGTAAGTKLLADVMPGAGSSWIESYHAAGGNIFFAASEETSAALWVSDATPAGTAVVWSLSHSSRVYVEDICAVGDFVYFSAQADGLPVRVYRTDGTISGTVLLYDAAGDPDPMDPSKFVAVGDRLFFLGSRAGETRLWTSEGAAESTVETPAPIPYASGPLVAFGDSVVYRGYADDVYSYWRSDGTAGGTASLGLTAPDPSDSGYPPVGNYVSSASGVLFLVSVGPNGPRLYASDGTAAGTEPVADVAGEWMFVGTVITVGDEVYFSGVRDNRRQLVVTDGTAAGTRAVYDYGETGVYGASSLGDRLLFTVVSVSPGSSALWVSDGTVSGTTPLADATEPATSAVYYTAGDLEHSAELWRSDGTAAGTGMVRDINTVTEDSGWSGVVQMGDSLYFATTGRANPNNRFCLWKSDGTPGGTVLLREFNPTLPGNIVQIGIAEFTVVGDTLFFTVWGDDHGLELWKTDGTVGGTVLVRDIRPGSAGSYISGLRVVADTLLFFADDGLHGLELWSSDGTAAGTVLVRDILPGSASGTYDTDVHNKILVIADTLYFSADDGTHGYELWKSDGTTAGTVLVRDIFAGSTGSSPTQFYDVGGTLFFAVDYTNGGRLWRSDGTAAGTVLVRDVRLSTNYLVPSGPWLVAGGKLYFEVRDVYGVEPWVSDGTAAGTFRLRNIRPDLDLYIGGSDPLFLGVVGGSVFFSADDGTHGRELWRTDGTTAGTVLWREFSPGSQGADIGRMVTLVDTAYFFVGGSGDGVSGYLWKTDGTVTGTVPLDNPAGLTAAARSNLRHVGGAIYFSATEPLIGAEPYRLDLATAAVTAPASVRSGAAFSVTVAVRDDVSGALIDYDGPVTLSVSDGPTALTGTLTATAVNGVAVFDGLSLRGAGSYTLRAVGPGFATGFSATVNVTAASLAFDLVPATVRTTRPGLAGHAPFAVRVRALAADGSVAANFASNVALAVQSGPGAMGGTLTVAATGGVATFDTIFLPRAGAYRLRASAFGLPAVASPTIVAAANRLTISVTKQPGKPAFVTVRALDADGLIATNFTGQVTLYKASGPGTLRGNLTVTAVAGVASFVVGNSSAGTVVVNARTRLVAPSSGANPQGLPPVILASAYVALGFDGAV